MRNTILLILLATSLLVATSHPTGAIFGFVKDEVTREPIPAAIVIASGPSRGVDSTCQMGGYLITNLIPGRYEVRAHAQGYEPKIYPQLVPVVAGETTRNINLFLSGITQHGRIAGNVLDARTRRPIPNALVIAEGPVRQEARTNSHGDYIIGHLPPGSYRVIANAHEYQPERRENVIVRSSEIAEVNFSLVRLHRYGGISGRIIDSQTRNPIENALVTIEGPSRAQVQTNREGIYIAINLNPGEYRVTAQAHEYLPETRGRVMVRQGEITQDVNFTLERMLQTGVIGKVVDIRTRQPIENTLITAIGPMRYETRTNRNGDFTLMGLQPGVYQVTTQVRGYQPQTRDSIHVIPGRITDHVDFFLHHIMDNEMDEKVSINEDIILSINPNPCTKFVRISLNSSHYSMLKVYDATGKFINTLWQGVGKKEVTWNRNDIKGNELKSGTYFISLENGNGRKTMKVIVR